MAKALFILLDLDESGELEVEEIMVLQERQMFFQRLDAKAKESVQDFIKGMIKKAKRIM